MIESTCPLGDWRCYPQCDWFNDNGTRAACAILTISDALDTIAAAVETGKDVLLSELGYKEIFVKEKEKVI